MWHCGDEMYVGHRKELVVQLIGPLFPFDGLTDTTATIATPEIDIVPMIAVLTNIIIASQSRSFADPHGSDQFDMLQWWFVLSDIVFTVITKNVP